MAVSVTSSGWVLLAGGGEPGFGEDVEADVAAHLGPFVVLLGQDGADEADQGVAAGEDPDDVGAAADLPVQPLLRVVGPDLPPDRLRERGEGQDVGAGGVEVAGDLRGACPPGRPGPGRTGRARRRRRAGRRPSAAAPGPSPTRTSGSTAIRLAA